MLTELKNKNLIPMIQQKIPLRHIQEQTLFCPFFCFKVIIDLIHIRRDVDRMKITEIQSIFLDKSHIPVIGAVSHDVCEEIDMVCLF